MGPKPTTAVCHVCGGKYHAKGLCKSHYVAQKNAAHYQRNKEKYHARTTAWRAANPAAVKAIYTKGHAKHRKKRNAAAREYRAVNRDKVLSLQKAWYHANIARQLAYNAYRRATPLAAGRAFQDEYNTFVVQEAYRLAKVRTAATGLAWQVDHIVPLKSKIVCGLHCAANIRVIPAVENWSKGNRHWQNMP